MLLLIGISLVVGLLEQAIVLKEEVFLTLSERVSTRYTVVNRGLFFLTGYTSEWRSDFGGEVLSTLGVFTAVLLECIHYF